MLTTLLLIGAVIAQCLAAPSSSDLQTDETKWKGWHGGVGGGGPGLYNRGLGPGGWGPYGGAWGRGFAGGPYGFYNDPRFDDWASFSVRAFPGGPDPWGLGYSGFGPWIYR